MRGQEYGVRHYVVNEPTTLIQFLTDTLTGSFTGSLNGLALKERVLELLDLGSIYVNDVRVIPAAKSQSQEAAYQMSLATNSRVRVHLEPRRFAHPSDLASRITEQNESFLIVDKPAGLPVHALVDNRKENLISFLEKELDQKLLVTHRLDVDTTGLVILAKTVEAQAAINSKFKAGTVKRAYLALTEHELKVATYIHFMEQSPKAPKVVSVAETEGSLRCELRVVACREAKLTETEVQTSLGRYWNLVSDEATMPPKKKPSRAFEIEIELVTGRTHQIRAQLSALGAPLLGDQMYGSGFRLTDSSTGATAIALWAFKIQTTPDETILRTS